MKTGNKLILMLVLATTGMWGCQDLIKDYELDTNPDFLKTMTLEDYIKQGRDTSLTLYAEALEYANMSELASEGEQTRIVPTNNAIRNLLSSAGASNLSDFSPNVVKQLFSYLIFPGMFRSTDLDENETVEGETLIGDPLYLTRLTSSTDQYRVVVNGSNRLATPPIDVIRQDYVFMDGVAHVVDYFPTYQLHMLPTDTVPEGVDYSGAEKDRISVTGETHVYQGGGGNSNYDSQSPQLVSRPNVRRYAFFRFDEIPSIDYVEDLVSARLRFRVRKITGSNYEPVCAVHETVHNDWTAPTLTWKNMPDFGPEIATGTLLWDGSSAGVWNEINITSYIQNAYQEGKSVISLGLQALNGANITSSAVQIWHSETANGIYAPSIELMGPIASDIYIDNASPIIVEANGIIVLTKDHFSMAGPQSEYTYTDNNILFSLMEVPTNGTLTKYGLPMTKFTQFTQQELRRGAIKYVHNGGGNDSFQLKALDYIGGVYADLLPISVNVQ